MTIAQRIQSLRKARGMSQEELAEQVGVSRQAVSKWEANQSLPDLDKIIALSDFFGVSTDYLLKGSDTQTKQGTAAEVFPPEYLRVVLIVATIVNLIAAILSIALWRQFQTPICTAVGLIGLVMGTGLFLMVSHCMAPHMEASTAKHYKRRFWTINVWLYAFAVIQMLWYLVPFGLSIACCLLLCGGITLYWELHN